MLHHALGPGAHALALPILAANHILPEIQVLDTTAYVRAVANCQAQQTVRMLNRGLQGHGTADRPAHQMKLRAIKSIRQGQGILHHRLNCYPVIAGL